jgi:hypothetical protein
MIMRFAMFLLPEIEDGDFLRQEEIESWINNQNRQPS